MNIDINAELMKASYFSRNKLILRTVSISGQ